jgi:two-component system LytT family response regulator
MKAIIIDDEKRSADNLRLLITENCPDVQIISICNDAKEGIEAVCQLLPDLLFLDIEMPFANGFTVAEAVREAKPNIIFTTAFAEYAVKAFRVNACDYLLKPIDPAELRAAVDKIRAQPADADEMLRRIEAIEKTLQRPRNAKLAIQGVEGYFLVDYSDVIRLEASSNYTHIHCINNKKYTVAKLLREFEEQLSGDGFFRTHSSHLVNLSCVIKYLRGDGGYLVMSDGAQIEVSRSRKKELLKVLLGEE